MNIFKINESESINNISMIISTSVTGLSSKKLTKNNQDNNLSIENIQNKYTNRFKNRLYYTIGSESDDGQA